MKTKTYRLFFLIISLLALPGLAGWSAGGPGDDPSPQEQDKSSRVGHEGLAWFESSSASGFLSPAGTSDRYGYVLSDATYNWVEINTATPLFLSGDDAFTDPVDIGFNFKFYENTYTQLYVSTNGILTFGQGSSSFVNTGMPQDTSPDDLIAAFWDDLAVGGNFNSGKVFAAQGADASGKYLAVEWYQITRRYAQAADLLTFEVLLYENGNILIQYQAVGSETTSCTVGIEDGDGIAGLTYLYETGGLAASKAILFTRPGAAARVKALPAYQGDFSYNHEAIFNVEVRNIGELGPDRYNLSLSSSNSGWTASLYAADGATPLTDTNADGVVDTGLVEMNASATVVVILRAAAQASVGSWVSVTLTAHSLNGAVEDAVAKLQSAIPAPYAQALSDNKTGIRLRLVSDRAPVSTRTENWFSGSTLALSPLTSGGYIYVWERNYNKIVNNETIDYTDIEFATLDKTGRLVRTSSKLTDNQAVNQSTRDRYPVVASSPDGKVGVLWVHEIRDTATAKTNHNIYF
ncbi:MAG: hypothetical protein EHM70_26270, partial [Chloroflexota bacterium]